MESMAITTSEARRDLFGLIERVNLDHTEVEITSKRGSAILMSKDEYDSLVETSYLLRSPENRVERLVQPQHPRPPVLPNSYASREAGFESVILSQ